MVPRILVVVMCWTVASCGDGGTDPNDQTGCNANNCAGCCLNGTCQIGQSNDACGAGGISCTSCGSMQSCMSGACVSGTACGPSNCNGCCQNGQCLAGTNIASCGKSGATCDVCDMGQSCNMNQVCALDPAGRWRVQPISASITANNNGTDWDADVSPPDVIVRMTCPPSNAPISGATAEVESYMPSWTSGGCVTTAGALLAEDFVFQVWDVDNVVDDTITAPLGFRFTEQHFADGSVSFLPTQGLQTLTVMLLPQ